VRRYNNGGQRTESSPPLAPKARESPDQIAKLSAERGGITILHLPLFLALRTGAFLFEIGRNLMFDDGLLQIVENLFALLQCQAHRFNLRLGTHQVSDLLKMFRSTLRDSDYLDAEVHVVSIMRSAAFTSRRLKVQTG
jgi:hypothetical protein